MIIQRKIAGPLVLTAQAFGQRRSNGGRLNLPHHDPRSAATAFLLGAQSDDGAWRDFALEPGESDSWLTAFVALVLTRVSHDPNAARAVERGVAVQRAVGFLLARARVDAASLPVWGYNSHVPPDADSTAHVALLLHATGHEDAPRAGRALLGWMQPDGGLATFRRSRHGDSWGQSHADVTGVAVRAMHRTGVDGALLAPTMEYLRAAMTPAGQWSSYWWTTDWFATAAVLRAFRELRTPFVADGTVSTLQQSPVPTTAFDAALQLSISRLLGDGQHRERRLLALLRRTQLADGSWESVPRLRVTNPYAGTSGHLRTGPVGVDQRRLYTTAHVLHALSRRIPPADLLSRSGEA